MVIETTGELSKELYKLGRKLREEGRHEEAGIVEQGSIRLLNVWTDANDARKFVGLKPLR